MKNIIGYEKFKQKQNQRGELLHERKFKFFDNRLGTPQAVEAKYETFFGEARQGGLVTYITDESVTIGGKPIRMNSITEYYDIQR